MFKRYWWMLLVMAVVGGMVGFMVSAVVTYVMPKKFESTVTIEVRPDSSDQGTTAGTVPPRFIATEMEKLLSRNSLLGVIEALDLTQRWGNDRESIVPILRQLITVKSIRGTSLISVSVRHTDREEARDLASEVMKAYRNYRVEAQRAASDKKLSSITKALREQEDKVEESGKILRIREDLEKSNLGSDPKIVGDLEEARRDFETDQTLLDQLKVRMVSQKIETETLEDLVLIHDEPVIARAPISPNVNLNLVVGLIGGILLSPFFALPLMWLMNRKHAVGSQE